MFTSVIHGRLLSVVVVVGLSMSFASVAAASSWNPTLLINTESFNAIDAGDGTTNIELRFGDTLNRRLFFDISSNRFIFTQSVQVGGDLTATGSLSVKGNMSGSTLRVDHNADIWGNISASGTLKVNGAATFGSTIKINGVTYTFPFTDGSASGKVLGTNGAGQLSWTQLLDPNSLTQTTGDARYLQKAGDAMTGNMNISNGGGLNASGSILTNGNLTINSDNEAADAVLTFGNNVSSKTLKFSATNNRFEFNAPLKVNGNLSGSSLTVDGTVSIRGQSYLFPTSVTNGAVLKTDANGNLSWATSVGSGSGNVFSLNPEYSNAVYFSSGSTFIGQLTNAYDATNNQNYYHWTSTKVALQDYWVAVRVRVPDNFSNWSANPISFAYRTSDANAAVNSVTLRMLDTAGVVVPLTGGSDLANITWTTATISGPQTAGTFTPGGFITLYLKFATTSAGSADAASLTLHWSSTTP